MKMTLLEMSAAGTALIAAVFALRCAAGRKLPKGTFVALWWVAALRLLLPFAPQSRFSLYTLLEAARSVPAPAVPAPPVTGTPVVLLPGARPAAPLPAAARAFPVWTAVWICGAAALGMWFLWNYLRWRRRFREALPVRTEASGASCACVKTRRRVRVRVSDRISAPLTYGLLRPVVLLPKSMDLSDEAALDCVLAHETVHIRRLDGLFKLVLAAAVCVHWFNPASWLLYTLANRDMELRCDEAALRVLGEERRELYALTLIHLAERRSVPLCGFSRKSGMEERIKAIMNFRKKSVLAWAAALLAVVCVTTVFATSARKPASGENVNTYTGPDAELLAQSSAESAALWEETLAPYLPFGLTYTFDDPDLDGNGLTMYFEGREIRGLYDEHENVWISEHSGNGSYGPDAGDLYAVYDGAGTLTGLRFATEEESAMWDQLRETNTDMLVVEQLYESVTFDNDVCSFTIPEAEGKWNIWISGRWVTEDGMGMSVHYLEEESERGEWVPGRTYSFAETSHQVDELIMDVRFNDARITFDPLNPETVGAADFGTTEPPAELPAFKEDMPKGAAMIWPVDSMSISAPYGEGSHSGVDIAGLAQGDPIYAAASGTVLEAAYDAQNGNYIRLRHENGLETVYAHCRTLLVEQGETVEMGQTIAEVGKTGMATGPHLHFEILSGGEALDPAELLKAAKDRAETLAPLAAAAEKNLVEGQYPVNKNGQTYAANEALTDTLGAPDLVGVIASNGEYGYVSLKELNTNTRVAWGTRTAVTDPEAAEDRILPVYNEAGDVIGEFTVKAGKSGAEN